MLIAVGIDLLDFIAPPDTCPFHLSTLLTSVGPSRLYWNLTILFSLESRPKRLIVSALWK